MGWKRKIFSKNLGYRLQSVCQIAFCLLDLHHAVGDAGRVNEFLPRSEVRVKKKKWIQFLRADLARLVTITQKRLLIIRKNFQKRTNGTLEIFYLAWIFIS